MRIDAEEHEAVVADQHEGSRENGTEALVKVLFSTDARAFHKRLADE